MTVATDAIPRRRAATLADDAFVGGRRTRLAAARRPTPGTRRSPTRPMVERRTAVASRLDERRRLRPGAVRDRATPRTITGPLRPRGAPPTRRASPSTGGADPLDGRAAGERPSAARATASDGAGLRLPSAGRRPRAAAIAARSRRHGRSSRRGGGGPTPRCRAAGGPARPRRADAAAAAAATGGADDAATRGRRALRARDAAPRGAGDRGGARPCARPSAPTTTTIRAADAAAAIADPRAVRREKEAAQAAVPAAVDGGDDRRPRGRGAGLAARDQRINTEARTAAATGEARACGRHDGRGARSSAWPSRRTPPGSPPRPPEAACLTAREAVAECDERARARELGASRSRAGAVERTPDRPVDEDERWPRRSRPAAPRRSSGSCAATATAMTGLVAELAGDDPSDAAALAARLTELVDAIVADAIEAASLEFPADHPFWGAFTRGPGPRHRARRCASLGYRFDGLGGWVDDRDPTQRDLSLALGYAGLDPMRIRQWPTEAEMAALFSDVAVAADEYLAGDRRRPHAWARWSRCSGRRADGLAELWNDWGRVRPLLLEGA